MRIRGNPIHKDGILNIGRFVLPGRLVATSVGSFTEFDILAHLGRVLGVETHELFLEAGDILVEFLNFFFLVLDNHFLLVDNLVFC